MKQKIVMKVTMPCEKCRSKAMSIAARAEGVISMGIIGDYKDRLEVVGDGIDPVCLVKCLRKKLCHAEILLVEEVKDKKKPDDEKKPDDKKKPDKKKPDEPMAPVVVHPPPQWCPGCHYCCPPLMIVYEEPSGCAIM